MSMSELEYDRKIALTDRQEAEIKEYEADAFVAVLDDEAVFFDRLLDIAPIIRQAVLDSNDCPNQLKDARLSDVMFNASHFNAIVHALKDAMHDDIKELAYELWEENQYETDR